MNKCLNVIILLLGLLLFTCCGKEAPKQSEARCSSESHTALAEIDSLMWRRADSAFALLQEFVVSPEAEALDTFDGHYCQLLISELLYKNYQPQANRDKLLRAVDYFDSLCGCTDVARNVSTFFLNARAHYINGAGYYERDSVVEACKEDLKTLDVMEGHFEERELVGHKARFLANTYNRLGDLFSEQFMMESSISCYEKALVYCRIEPTSPNGVSNILYRIGKQYDKKNEIENARSYYSQALETATVTDNMVYRDIVASKALCDYKVEGEAKYALNELSTILTQAYTENERLNRYFTIGCVYFFDRNYDSALFYFESVFANKEDVGLQTQAAGYLRIVYDSIGDVERSDNYMRFLANQKKPDGENKALVSKLEDLYKNYSNKKLEKQAEAEREIAKKKVLNTVVPIGIAVALAIFCVLIWRNRRQLKFQQEEADKAFGEAEQEHEKELRLWQAEADKTLEETKKKHEEELETERLAYQKEQEAMRQSLQQREAQISALEKALDQQREEAAKQRAAFLDEEVCQRILELLHGKHITSRDTSYQHGIGLKEEDFAQLKDAVERHYKGFDNMLLSQCAAMKQSDLTLCHLHLLGLNEGEIGALKDRTYSAIKKQNESLQEKLGVEESLSAYVLKVAEGLCGLKNDDQKEEENMLLSQIMNGFEGQTEEISQESTLKSTLKGTQKTIVEIIISNPNVTIPEVAKKLDLNPRGIAKHFKTLQDKGVIRRVGPDKGGRWEVIS